MRKKWIWCENRHKLIPEEEYRAESGIGLHFTVTKGEFNHGLGQYIGNRQDRKDAINRINDTTGQHLVEIGNEKPRAIKSESYRFTRDQMYDMHKMLGD